MQCFVPATPPAFDESILFRPKRDERNARVVKADVQAGTVLCPAGSFYGRDEQGDDDMLSRILTAAALATVLATTAYAANTTSSSPPNTNTMTDSQQTAQNLPQEIRAKLKDDGFSDVKVVPGSFIVSAKDKRGEPVTMVISPNSTMMVTQVANGTGSSTNGQK